MAPTRTRPAPGARREDALAAAERVLRGEDDGRAFYAGDAAGIEGAHHVNRRRDPEWALAAKLAGYVAYLAAGIVDEWAGTEEPRFLDLALRLAGAPAVRAALVQRLELLLG